jgi:hypothetical protein
MGAPKSAVATPFAPNERSSTPSLSKRRGSNCSMCGVLCSDMALPIDDIMPSQTTESSRKSPWTDFYSRIRDWMRDIASSTFCRLLKALRRMYPSPDTPKPLPGVQTTWHSFSSRSKNCQLVSVPGVFTQA